MALRNVTWCPDNFIFTGTNTGAGLMTLDGDVSNPIKRMVVHYGNIFILRNDSVYLASGSISRQSYGIDSASVPTTRKLNIKYGMIGEDVVDLAGALWFMTYQGLAKIDGVSAYQMSYQQFDNIGTTIKTIDIKRVTDGIPFRMTKWDRFIYLHDDTIHVTYKFDSLTESWERLTGRYCQCFVDNSNWIHSIYNGIVMRWEDGYRLFNPTDLTYTDEQSYYTMHWIDFGSHFLHKELHVLELAGDSGVPPTLDSNLVVKVYAGEPGSLVATNTQSISDGNTQTWTQALAMYPTWGATGSDWNVVSGENISEYYRKIFHLGIYHEVQLRIEHNENCAFRCFMMEIYFQNIKQYLQGGV